jgi:putative hydrolase of the HAD superfamily
MTKLRAVVFDLDDTLYPEREYVCSGFLAVSDWAARTLGFSAVKTADQLTALYEQGIRGRTFDIWLEKRGIEERRAECLEQMIQTYRAHVPCLKPFPGMRELIMELGRSYQLGLVSDGLLSMQQNKWKALAFGDSFQAVVFSDAFGRACWKPSRVPFEKVLDELGVSPEAAVYVGDNPSKDFIGARQIGMGTVRFRTVGGEHASANPMSPSHAPDCTVDDIQALGARLFAGA